MLARTTLSAPLLKMNSLALTVLVAHALWGFIEAAPTGTSTGSLDSVGVCEKLFVDMPLTELVCSFGVNEITNSSLQALHFMRWNATSGSSSHGDASYECRPLTLTTRRNGTLVLAYIPVRVSHTMLQTPE